ncbi:MAG: 4-hydroxy-tetrahydrodipicolinate synthase [Candidatus Hodarchaeota archaeon]
MRDFELKGIMPALVTPFTKTGEVDAEAFRRLVRFVIDEGVTGILAGGTTGEFVNLSLEERKETINIALEETNKRVPVVAGTGHSSTKYTIKLSEFAYDAGVDAVLIVSPYYLGATAKSIYEHFYEIAKAIDLPLILYNIPQSTGNYIPREVVEDLATIDNIVGIKDSSGDFPYFMSLLEKVGDTISIVVGYDEIVFPALVAGARGAILASANIIPDIWLKIYDAVQNNNLAEARKLQMEIQKLTRIVTRHGGPLPVKSALKMMDLKVGKTRPPIVSGGSLTWEVREEMRLELERLGKIKIITKGVAKTTKPLKERFEDLNIKPDDIASQNLKIGEASIGKGAECAEASIVAGATEGIVGEAYATALTSPRPGYEALTVILEPNLMVRPPTIIVPEVEIQDLRQATMVYGPIQAAAGMAILESIKNRIIPEKAIGNHVMILKVFAHPKAIDRHKLYWNYYKAIGKAINGAWQGGEKYE